MKCPLWDQLRHEYPTAIEAGRQLSETKANLTNPTIECRLEF